MAKEEKGAAEKKRRAPAQPKPVYVVYKGEDGELNVLAATRKSDRALEVMDKNPGAKYKRVMVDE